MQISSGIQQSCRQALAKKHRHSNARLWGVSGRCHGTGEGVPQWVWINYCGHVELSRGEKSDRKWTLVDHIDVVMPHSLLNHYD